MNTSNKKLKSFARETVSEYDKKTVLDSITDLEIYDEGRHSYRNFVQLGKRVSLPERFFYSNDSTPIVGLPSSFIDPLISSEEKFALSSIENAVKEEQLESYVVDEFTFESIVVESFDYVYEPDQIYIPNRKEYRMILQKWRENGRMMYEESEQYIIGGSKMEVNWIPRNWGFTDVFIFNSNDINVVQKRYKDTESPKYIKHLQNVDISREKDKLMVYMGEIPEEPDEFEFFYRIMLSEPTFTGHSPHGATIARLSDDSMS